MTKNLINLTRKDIHKKKKEFNYNHEIKFILMYNLKPRNTSEEEDVLTLPDLNPAKVSGNSGVVSIPKGPISSQSPSFYTGKNKYMSQ